MALATLSFVPDHAAATSFTMTVPGTNISLPSEYPEAGGVAFVVIGDNGNIYYQFSNPQGAFVGFQNRGRPRQFRGNPFTINDPVELNCGFSSCSTYFGGGIAQVYIRFTADDGDTSPGNFDEDDIFLILNGYNVGNWSDVTAESTNTTGTVSYGFTSGFSDRAISTGWFSSSDPALANSILSTGQTTTQVFDRDPNDNYWDFSAGENIRNNDLITVAPGYEIEKTADRSSYAAIGETVNYTYTVTNIGSVQITDIAINDDKIPSVTCDTTTVDATTSGSGSAQFATCTGSYVVTQADIDAGEITNIATASGTPTYGNLGNVSDTVTITGPARTPVLSFEKTADVASIAAAGDIITYTLSATNDGNVTLTNVEVTDPKLPSLSCIAASLAPGDDLTCSQAHTVTQSEFETAVNGSPITNTATARADTPLGTTISQTDTATVAASAPQISLTIDKSTGATSYSAVGETIVYSIDVTNTSNVAWPSAPTVNDSIAPVNCPTGGVAIGATVTCNATYAITQADLDAGSLLNTATASISVAGQSASQTDSVTLIATRTPLLTLDKSLNDGSATTYAATTDTIDYDYTVTNGGNVTIENLTVTDDRLAVTCPVTSLAPSTTTVCTATETAITQNDIDAGAITNTAYASGTAATLGEAVQSNSDQVTVNAEQNPAISLDKTAGNVPPPQFVAGRTITYTFDVENTGNTTLVGPITVVDDKIGTFECNPGNLAPTASIRCSRDYTITTQDQIAGFVTNVATVQDANGDASAQDSETVAPNFDGGISLVKSADVASVSSAGETVNYTFTVTNTGTATITEPITIDDPLISGVDCSSQPAALLAGQSFDCTGALTTTQTQIDQDSITNTAIASTSYNGSTFSSAPSTVTISVNGAPSISIVKSGPAEFTAKGEVLTYSLTATNTGNKTLSQIAVTDPLITNISCPSTTLAPSAAMTCSGDYTVTQSDLDSGTITNTAAVAARTPSGAALNEPSNTVIANAAAGAQVAAATLDKTANIAEITQVGEQIIYTLAVTNTGTVTLNNLSLTDALDSGWSCSISTLAPSATNNSCRFAHVVSQSEFDSGSLTNNATLSGAQLAVDETDTITLPVAGRNAGFTSVKTVDQDYTTVGDTLNFGFTVENTGNVTLSNVTVSDAQLGLNCVIGTLAPGAIDTSTCSAAHSVTQSDIDAGSYTNTATVSADAPAGVTAPADQSPSVTANGPTSTPSIDVTKSGPANFALNDTLTWTFSIENTGNVTLTNVTINDPALGFSCAVGTIAPSQTVTQCADTTPFSVSRTATQADVDAGSVQNTVTASGSAPDTTVVSDTASVLSTGPARAPAISIDKTADTPNYAAVGDTIDYTITVTNTGNVTLTSPFDVSDPLADTLSCAAVPAAGLAPSASFVCTASYEVTQADLDSGSFTNTATATTSDQGEELTVSDDATVTAGQNPAIALAKYVAETSASTYGAVGDTVTFEYRVTNTGNVTLTDPITVTDDKIPAGSVDCNPGTLAPGANGTCTLVWTADQAAIDAGSVTNIGTAQTIFDGLTYQATDTATVTARQTPSLTTLKEVTTTPPLYSAGETIGYTYTITNNGNVTIDGPFSVTDNLIGTISCGTAGSLPPAATTSCTANYVVTDGDISLGSTVNVATSAGTFDGAAIESPPTSVIYPNDPVLYPPALSIAKSADAVTYDTLGQVITYTYTVTNTGKADLNGDINVIDNKIGSFICRDTATYGNFAVGDSFDCTAPYSVTQADLDGEELSNDAYADTVYTYGGTNQLSVVSAPDNVTITTAGAPAFAIVKTGDATAFPAVGDTVTFTIEVQNTGNQTLSNVIVSDNMPELALSCTDGTNPVTMPQTMSVGDSWTCTAPYTVDQDDIDAQTIINTATVRGDDPKGVTITASSTVNQPVEPAAPNLTITKEITSTVIGGVAFGAVGQDIEYRITVTNTGNVTLADVSITDDLVPGTCDIGTLSPTDTDNSCTYTYTATQADIDAENGPAPYYGGVTNTATATYLPVHPTGTEQSVSDSVFARGPDHILEFTLQKTALDTGFAAVGDTLDYQYVVANTGNVTLTAQPVISDDKIGTVTCPAIAPGLAPRDFVLCTATYAVTQDDVDAGFVTNVAEVTSTQIPVATTTAIDDATVTGTRSPAIRGIKTATTNFGTDGRADAGDTVDYTFTVSNTGNVTLFDINVTETAFSGTGGAPTITYDAGGAYLGGDAATIDLPVGQNLTFVATYTLTQDDVDAGDIENSATVSGTAPDASIVSDVTGATQADDDATIVDLPPVGAVEVLKTVSNAPVAPIAGDAVTFTITAENTGNVTLSDPVLTDTLTRKNGALLSTDAAPAYVSGDTDTDGEIDTGEVWTYTVSYTLQQADIDAGGINNSATVAATTPAGATVSDISDDGTGPGNKPASLDITALPSIETEKTLTNAVSVAGETAEFAITVQNTGNVTLTAIALTDTLTRADSTVLTLTSGPTFTGADLGSGPASLLPNETATYLATYTLTQSDVDAGGVSNTVIAQGAAPSGQIVNDEADTPATLTIAAAPAITIAKSRAVGSLASYDTVGDVLDYSFVLTNTGNITLTGPFTVSDPLIENAGGSLTCGAGPLGPNDTLTCSGSYAVTQADIDAGSVANTATASAEVGTPATSNTVTIPAIQTPDIDIVKTVEPVPAEEFVVGAIIEYTYTVTNTGNTTLTDPITVADNRIDTVDCPALPAGGLAPAQSITCSADYVVTADDVDLFVVTNLATAQSGDLSSLGTTVSIPEAAVPALSMTKTAADGATFAAVGDVLDYTFTVENAGTRPFVRDVIIVDPLIGDITCWTATAGDETFAPGDTATCYGSYPVVQSDLDNGEVVNQAYASTQYGAENDEVVSDPQAVTVPAAGGANLSLTKTANPTVVAAVGEVVTFTITALNDGNRTLRAVTIDDPMIDALTCTVGGTAASIGAELAPTEALECTGTYTVTQSDLDAGTLTNTASASAVTPKGSELTATATANVTLPAQSPAIALAKTATPNEFGAVGSSLTYLLSAQNVGNVTMFDVTITDPMAPNLACTIETLAPNAVSAPCSFSIQVIQEMVDAGDIENTASVTAATQLGTYVSDSATLVTDGPDQLPAVEATKTASAVAPVAGEVITYTLTVENTGNVTLSNIALTDTMQRVDNTAVQLDAPFAYVAGDDGDGLLNVTEAWIYTARYTVTQTDLDAGGVFNSVDVTAVSPQLVSVSDTSDDGNDTDGNTADDPTETLFVAGPALDVIKTVTTAGSAVGDVLEYTITARNIGNVTLNAPVIADTMTRLNGDAIAVTPTLVSGAAPIAPSEMLAWTVTYTLTQGDIDSGGISNTATVTMTAPNDVTVSDVSDDGDDADGNTADDPTITRFAPAPEMDITKLVGQSGDKAGDPVTFDVYALNTGNVTLSNVTLVDTMTRADGTPISGITATYVTSDFGSAEGTIVPGETATYEVTYVLTQADVDATGLENQITATATSPTGATLFDLSDNDATLGGDTPTELYIAPAPVLNATLSTDFAETAAAGTLVPYVITVENTGNVSLDAVSFDETLWDGTGSASGFAAVPAYVDGDANNDGLVTPGEIWTYSVAATLTDTIIETGVLSASVDVSAATQNNAIVSDVSDDTDDSDGNTTNDPEVIAFGPSDLFVATKTANRETVGAGDVVTFTLDFTNNSVSDYSDIVLVDRMPNGLGYVPGSATVNGAAREPDMVGSNLTWDSVDISAGNSATVTFNARVTQTLSDGAEIVNRTFAENAAGQRISTIGTVTLRMTPEGVFDCSDVIGKVWIDTDGNNRQTEGEAGVPATRIATQNGLLITTDAFGRFHVPCAALPRSEGSNFTIELDTRSLPQGVGVLSENPRSLRLTAGMAAEMNFAVGPLVPVQIALTSDAFGDDDQLPEPLGSAIATFVADLSGQPSQIELVYILSSTDSDAVALDRLDMVETAIKRAARAQRGTPITVIKTVQYLQ
ncbi:hypothetical protein BVC71_03660 [Marivivens niveibacter]|uniref:DUF11 domain-containing protein n=2 Tax=Marivivens niveibacter TaxID=1930667 RepID=A0A251X1J6_9RHOB|nr:hypothetical protein BVC71_03660 [Marivivens niveibacter]